MPLTRYGLGSKKSGTSARAMGTDTITTRRA